MRKIGGLRIAILAVLALMGGGAAAAQEVRGFVAAASTTNLNDRKFTGLGGGVVIDTGLPWVSGGALWETFFDDGYVSGRGTVFGQGNLFRAGSFRTFVLGGVGFGVVADGPLFGGGFEVRPPRTRVGVRASVQDYLTKVDGVECARFGLTASYCAALPHGGKPYTGHQLALTIGILF
jgi:hypothetical protein